MSPLLAGFVIALAVSAVLTPVARALATRAGILAKPVADRWHRRPVALMGGVAIVAAFAAGLLPAGNLTLLVPLLVYAGLMFMLGAVDDVRHLRPKAKLAGQIVVAGVYLAIAPRLEIFGIAPLDLAVAYLWLVGITNAFNLLDNMDGLSAGVALIAGVFCLAVVLPAGNGTLVLALCAFAGAVTGFLIYNFHPASIFMGDGGSFFLGSFLAGSTLLAVSGSQAQFTWIAAVPVLILLIPIFDTAFVTLTRRIAGRSALIGGRDHTSHRLVALGMSERGAVLSLYALAAAGGVVALAVRNVGLTHSIALVGLYLTVVLAAGVVLGHVEVARAEAEREPATAPLVSELTYRNRLYEVGLDTALVGIAYYAAFRIRFQEPQFSAFLRPFAESFPIVVGCQLGALWLSGKYRHVWRSFGAAEMLTIVRGIAGGVAASVILMVYLYRFEGFSRGVFVIDAVLLTFLLVGARAAISSIDEYLRRQRASGRRVLIYGAGRGGALLLREVLQNRELSLIPVGFVDDAPEKRRLKVEGVPIVGDLTALPEALARLSIAEVLVAIRDLPRAQMDRLLDICAERQVSVRRMRFALDDVDGSGQPTIRIIRHAG